MVARQSFSSPEERQAYVRSRMHDDKVCYSSEPVAKNAATILSWISPSYAGMEAYACKFCEYFHIGHPYSRMKDAAAARIIHTIARSARFSRQQEDDEKTHGRRSRKAAPQGGRQRRKHGPRHLAGEPGWPALGDAWAEGQEQGW